MNATIQGAVVRANQLKLEIFGLIKGVNSLFNPRVPHVHLNPLYQEIPEIDPTKGGTMIGSSRDYLDPNKKEELDLIAHRLQRLGYRRPDLCGRRRRAQRSATTRGAPSYRPCHQDHR
jgi:6-phosphofructokinase